MTGTESPFHARHTLVVFDDGDAGRSYFLEHPEGCPYDHDDSFVIGGKFYRCVEGEHWSAVAEDSVADHERLAPGRYELRVVVEHTPSTIYGPAETDSWLEVVM